MYGMLCPYMINLIVCPYMKSLIVCLYMKNLIVCPYIKKPYSVSIDENLLCVSIHDKP